MSGCLVSIMIPTYNQAEFLPKAIESALEQTYSPLEIVISDDASPDPQVSAILKQYKLHSRVTVHVNETNLGRAKNYRTTLYDRTQGEWVINLDGDDYFYDPEFIEKAISMIEENAGIVMVSGRRLVEATTESKLLETGRNGGPERVMTSTEAYQALLDEQYYYWHATTLYHRETAMALDFYRYNMTSTDDDSFLRLMAYGDVGVIPLWAAVWRKHDGNASRNQPVEDMIDNLQAMMATKDIVNDPKSKMDPAFFKSWMTQHLISRTKPRVRELLKARRSLRDYFRYVWAITKLSPQAGLAHLLRPKNILRALRTPFLNIAK